VRKLIKYSDWLQLPGDLKTEIIALARLVGSNDGLTPRCDEFGKGYQYGRIISTGATGRTVGGCGFKTIRNMAAKDKAFCNGMLKHMKGSDNNISPDDPRGTIVNIKPVSIRVQVFYLETGERIGGQILISQEGYIKENGKGCKESWSSEGCFDENLKPLKITGMNHDGY
jgi:hypothetical protein